MSEFDDLERQLRHGVRLRGPGRRRPWWRGPGALLVVVPAASLAGVGAASGILDRASVASRANDLQHEIRERTARGADSPCRRGFEGPSTTSRFSDAAPLPELVRAFPTLGGPPRRPVSDAVLAEALRAARGSVVLRRSVRLARFPDGARLLLFATVGDPAFTVVDPDACRTLRLAAVDEPKDEVDPAVRRRARTRLARAQDTDATSQAYTISTTRVRPDGTGGGGGSSPVQAGRPVRVRGNWGVGSGGFSFIAHRRATVVRVQRVRPGDPARAWRGDGAYSARIRVREGLVGFFGRGGTSGRYRIVQEDRTGRVLERRVLPR